MLPKKPKKASQMLCSLVMRRRCEMQSSVLSFRGQVLAVPLKMSLIHHPRF